MSEHQYTRVGDVMTPKPHVIDGLATVRETIDLMRREQVSSVIVDRRHKGDEYGIVVVYDIAVEIVGKDRSPERTNVYEIMSKPVVAVEADMDIKYAIRLLSRFTLSRAVVLESGLLVGIVTLRDMVLRFAN
ncbi:MAG: CBS domain-containing protein [Rhodospirillaceae bacterium]|jgi:signal-transduction protein with cAMP-binding, CBS, and nucleotidyltransferase domain|nr:CBS domain-containing protein [Rhodospirillaceae bacterium]